MYKRDMTAVLGFVLPHDDSVNDRSEGSKLSNADDVTRELWHKAYGVSFGRPGSMYRGAPPKVSQPANRWDFTQSVQQRENVFTWFKWFGFEFRNCSLRIRKKKT